MFGRRRERLFRGELAFAAFRTSVLLLFFVRMRGLGGALGAGLRNQVTGWWTRGSRDSTGEILTPMFRGSTSICA